MKKNKNEWCCVCPWAEDEFTGVGDGLFECPHCASEVTVDEHSATHDEVEDEEAMSFFDGIHESLENPKEPGADNEKFEDVLDNAGDLAGGIVDSAWSFIRKLGLRSLLMWHLLIDWWNDEYPLPWRIVSYIAACLIYFVSPIDAIPDVIPIIGLADDAAVVAFVVNLIYHDLLDYCVSQDLDPEEYAL
jgi:uncharacterized membrane protein YkvA (DUF1232 family)